MFMQKLCFATLAVGEEYREHAKNLAFDLKNYTNHHESPKLIILTDYPPFFGGLKNVIVYKHKIRSNWYYYHDKRYALKKGLEKYKTCILIDADCRLLDSPPIEDYISYSIGLRALGVIKLDKKLEIEARYHQKSPLDFIKNTPSKRRRMLKNVSHRINAEYFNSFFMHEAIIIITRDDRNINGMKFLKRWDYAAKYLAIRGYEWGEGEVIGLAANSVGWEVYEEENIHCWLFKDLYNPQLKRVSDAKKIGKFEAYQIKRKVLLNKYKKSNFDKCIQFFCGLFRYLLSFLNHLLQRIISDVLRKS